jgi:hypothetical protein
MASRSVTEQYRLAFSLRSGFNDSELSGTMREKMAEENATMRAKAGLFGSIDLDPDETLIVISNYLAAFGCQSEATSVRVPHAVLQPASREFKGDDLPPRERRTDRNRIENLNFGAPGSWELERDSIGRIDLTPIGEIVAKSLFSPLFAMPYVFGHDMPGHVAMSGIQYLGTEEPQDAITHPLQITITSSPIHIDRVIRSIIVQ